MKKKASEKKQTEKIRKEKAAQESDNSSENLLEEDNEKDIDGKIPDPRETEESGSENSGNEKEIAELKDRYMRILAEYDNFRKRSRMERDNIYTDAIVDSVKEWLSVIDNIERAMEFAGSHKEAVSEKEEEGVALIQKQAREVLGKLGVEEISCNVGDSFDPNLHAAVTHIEDDSLEEQSIAAVFQKGYIIGDRVIRYAMVQVAN